MARDISELVDDAAEGGVLASLIYHPEYLLSDNNLQPRFFYRQENQVLYWAINTLVERGVTKIDALNLRNVLYSNAACQKVIERYGITNLQEYITMAQIAARGSYEEYKLLANTVISLAFRRELCSFSKDIGKECFNREITLDDLNDYVNNGISKIAEKFIFGGDSVEFAEKIDTIWEKICRNRNDDGTVGLPSLLPSLNDFMTFGKGELVLVAGPTGKGKSSYFLNEACYALKQGVPVVIQDTELTDEVWFPRLVACLSGVTVRQIKSGRYNKEEESRIIKTMDWLKSENNLVHEYVPIFNRMALEQICRKWLNKGKMGFFIYDYIKPSIMKGAAEISQSLGLMADFLKSIAGSMDVPVLGGLQLNKLTGQVADSMKPERYADVLMYWKEKSVDQLRTDGLDCGNYYLQVVKNRNGAIHDEDDYIDISFKGDYMDIREAKKHDPGGAIPFSDKKG